MQARVISTHPWRTAQACAGVEFVKGAWRRVPAGFEAEARRTTFLEVREQAVKETPPAPVVEETPPAPETPALPVKRVTRSRKK